MRRARVTTAARLVIVVAAFTALVAPLPASWVEQVYSRTVYAHLQPRLTWLTNLLPFAVIDVWIALGLVALIAAAAIGSRGRRRNGQSWPSTLASGGLRLLVWAAGIYLVFLACWGLNYRRLPLEARLGYRDERVDSEALRRLVGESTRELNALAPLAHARPWPGPEAAVRSLAAAFERALPLLDVSFEPTPGRPKRSLLGGFFPRASIDGFTNPWGLEILLNPDLLPVERPFTLAHEWGHLAGLARESEAGFLGWVSCLHGNVQERYSGWLGLYPHLLAALPTEERRAELDRLGELPRRDLRAIRERLSRASPLLSHAAWRSYDRFLRANRVPEGVASYSEVVRLVLGTGVAAQLQKRERPR